MPKGLRTQLITIVTAVVVALSVSVAAGSDDATSPPPEADAVVDAPQLRLSDIGNCERRQLKSGGRIKVAVPDFCRDRLCRLYVLWKGEPIGAYVNGLTWGVDYIQFNRGWWAAGPAVNIGGMAFSDGLGRNGDGIVHGLISGQTSDGSFIALMDDDPPYENGPGKLVFEMRNNDPWDPAIEYAQFWACAMG